MTVPTAAPLATPAVAGELPDWVRAEHLRARRGTTPWSRATGIDGALGAIAAGATPVGGATGLMSAAFSLPSGPSLLDVLPVLSAAIDGDVIGAGATLASVAASTAVRASWPALARAAALTATPEIRALATIGGTVAARLPTADLPAALAAHGATVLLRAAGAPAQDPAGGDLTRGVGHLPSGAAEPGGSGVVEAPIVEVPIVEYLAAPPGPHLVLGVRVAVAGAGSYRRFALRLGAAPAIATVAAVRGPGGLRVWGGACGPDAAPIPLSPVGAPTGPAPRSDARASGEWRLALLRALTSDVLADLGDAA